MRHSLLEPNSQSLTRRSPTELPVSLSLHQSQRKSPCRDGGSEPKAQGEPERPTVVQSVVDLAKAGRSQIVSRLGELRRVEEIDRFGAEGEVLIAADLPVPRKRCINVADAALP